MTLPKFRASVALERAVESKEAAEIVLAWGVVSATCHVTFGCFAQIVFLFADGEWKPSLCFALFGYIGGMAIMMSSAKLASRLPSPMLARLLTRTIPIAIAFTAIGFSIYYPLAREEWELALWAMVLLGPAFLLSYGELTLRSAERKIVAAKAAYDRELQELMDQLTC